MLLVYLKVDLKLVTHCGVGPKIVDPFLQHVCNVPADVLSSAVERGFVTKTIDKNCARCGKEMSSWTLTSKGTELSDRLERECVADGGPGFSIGNVLATTLKSQGGDAALIRFILSTVERALDRKSEPDDGLRMLKIDKSPSKVVRDEVDVTLDRRRN